ncbi:phosphoribosylglycinamide formyltransferase [Propionigenium maris DSM 9537]|uniref:Phosphoribosylglycinamide formyltransferase n=1 Tax=Propionigenium maris DSM 9537 TaxID=1123000 RepID=A0A9W6LPD4_9FUSO|nr:phosphoribosylglycinamide formyltransferase [Propionigenium maris]GLI56825.1 phosphoribosylglycinamide formyltransferase [Propionigenium maris DSM 9537]
MLKIAVLVSGGGSNLQSIIDMADEIGCSIELVVADRGCYGLERAAEHGIEGVLLDRKVYKKNLSEMLDEVLRDRVDLIVLAGFLSILDENITNRWKGRIINIHPSLLPKFGGPGMYGMNIHRAVVEAGERESGCTVHYVDAGVDTGEIIFQERVEVKPNDTPEDLQKRVLTLEHRLLPQAIKNIAMAH